MKILDRYILTTYLKTFLSVFVILLLIFVLQTIWLYIKELAGKDLDMVVVFKFLAYFMPKLIPLVIPLTILLSSIMVFGSFAENYEFAAMKSTGISLQRAMSGLSIFIAILGFTTFMFSNNVIPWAEYNSLNLRKNIAKLKPAMLLAEGQFNEVGDYNIKFDSKSGDKGQYLNNVTIHIKGPNKSKNATMIKSISGELIGKETSNVLKLILSDGNYYNDIPRKDLKEQNKQPFAKSAFEKYTINIDLSQINDNVDINDKSYTDRYNMLNLSELNYTIDSLTQKRNKAHQALSKDLHQRSNINRLKSKSISKSKTKPKLKPKNDSIYSGEILDLFETKAKSQLIDLALRNITSTKQTIKSKAFEQKLAKSNYNKHIVSFHEKLALGFACVILFFVGAPLGALIRKGGIGLPMVIAIVLFLAYHFIGIFAINSAKSGDFNPILASWFSTLVMFPLGVFLTKRATADKGLFEVGNVLEPLKKLLRVKKKTETQDTSVFDISSAEYETLNTYDNNKLANIVKKHKQYNYKIIYRNTALSILNSRGVTNQQLKFSGHFSDQEYEEALRLKTKYQEDAKLTLILYIFATLLGVIGAILENNKFPLIGNTLLVIGIVSEIMYLVSLVSTFISYSNYKKHTGNDSIFSNILFIILGLPLFFIVYFLEKKKIAEDLNLVINKKETEKNNKNNKEL